jgi:hypothetical protein
MYIMQFNMTAENVEQKSCRHYCRGNIKNKTMHRIKTDCQKFLCSQRYRNQKRSIQIKKVGWTQKKAYIIYNNTKIGPARVYFLSTWSSALMDSSGTRVQNATREVLVEPQRFLDADEVDLLLDVSLSADTAWSVVAATSDNDLKEVLGRLFEGDRDIRLITADTGCDALVACARSNPDMIIIDHDITDIPPLVLASYLRAHGEFGTSRILAAGSSAGAVDIPGPAGDDWYDKRENDPAVLSRKIRNLFDIPSMKDRLNRHDRRWPRTTLNIAAAVEVFDETGGSPVTTGKAIIKDISRDGALLSNITLKSGEHPEAGCRVRLHIDHPLLQRLTAESMVVRITSKDTAGIKFVGISKEDRHRITDLCDE